MTSRPQIRLDSTVRIAVLEPLRTVNRALLELLAGFDDEDWHRPTVHPDRRVKDLTAYLLHGSIQRISWLRDAYKAPPVPSFSTTEGLARFIQEDNRVFMNGMARVSPRILRELIERYDAELVTLFEALEPDTPGLGVIWAGERQSPNWFDVARQYTEKWHHQQQLRDATGRAPLYDPSLLIPVLETFARGLPHAYRALQAPTGTAISVVATLGQGIGWTLRRANDGWGLWAGLDRNASTLIEASPDLLWRLWTQGLTSAEARDQLAVTGHRSHAEPLLKFVAITA